MGERMKNVGEVIQWLKAEKNWTDAQLAAEAGLQTAHVNELKNNRRPQPAFETLEKIAHAAGVSVSVFSDESDMPLIPQMNPDDARRLALLRELEQRAPMEAVEIDHAIALKLKRLRALKVSEA